eukprot:gene1803-2471_t
MVTEDVKLEHWRSADLRGALRDLLAAVSSPVNLGKISTGLISELEDFKADDRLDGPVGELPLLGLDDSEAVEALEVEDLVVDLEVVEDLLVELEVVVDLEVVESFSLARFE